MFAPAHIPRTYSQHISQTTSKKNTNKENANALPSKTPSRAGPSKLAPSTSVRIGLGVKTVDRDRNVLGAPGRDEAKGKGRDVDEIEPKRLFQSTSHVNSSASAIQPSKSLSALSTTTQTRPTNTHKTPLPQRRLPPSTSRNTLRTPAPGFAVHPSEPAPLPSASRARRRSRNSVTPIRPSVSEEGFVTPALSGKWEEENSLGSVDEGAEVHLGLDGVVEVEEEGSEDEVEYMPPPVVELPWEPSWSHPNLGPIFETLSKLPPLWTPYDDSKPVSIMPPPLDFEDEQDPHVRLCSDEDLEEPMFRRKRAADPPLPKKQTKGSALTTGVRVRPTAPSVPRKVELSSTTRSTAPLGGRRPLPLTTKRPPMSVPTRTVTAKKDAASTQLARQPLRKAGPPVLPKAAVKPDPDLGSISPNDLADGMVGLDEVVYDLGLDDGHSGLREDGGVMDGSA